MQHILPFEHYAIKQWLVLSYSVGNLVEESWFYNNLNRNIAVAVV